MSSAISAWAIQRMQCASRAGPRRYWPSRWPWPRPPSMLASGTRRSSMTISEWPVPPCMVSTSRTSVPARRRDVDDERRVGRLRKVGVVLGAGDEDGERGAAGVGDEPLVAVDHPLVAVLHRGGADQRRVGAGDLGLGHREAAHLAARRTAAAGTSPSAPASPSAAACACCPRRAPGS